MLAWRDLTGGLSCLALDLAWHGCEFQVYVASAVYVRM